jgi:large subunit ribosomal protein L32
MGGFQQKLLFHNEMGKICSSLPAAGRENPAMAVPKRKQSNSRSGKRRSHDALKAKELMGCPKCSAAVPSHVVCPNCGYYMGRTIVESEEAST